MLPVNKLHPKNIDHLLFISGGRIQLADLHHGSSNSNHTRSKEGAVCLSLVDEVLHGLLQRPLRSSSQNPPIPSHQAMTFDL